MFKNKKPVSVDIDEAEDFLSEWDIVSVIERWSLNFHLGTVLLFIAKSAWSTKMQELSDLKVARLYLERYIELLEKDLKDVKETLFSPKNNMNETS